MLLYYLVRMILGIAKQNVTLTSWTAFSPHSFSRCTPNTLNLSPGLLNAKICSVRCSLFAVRIAQSDPVRSLSAHLHHRRRRHDSQPCQTPQRPADPIHHFLYFSWCKTHGGHLTLGGDTAIGCLSSQALSRSKGRSKTCR